METIYSIEYFIKKFSSIADQNIGKGDLTKQCALYHCGLRNNFYPSQCEAPDEVRSLIQIFGGNPDSKDVHDYEKIYKVNDGFGDLEKLGKTPKARILAALYDIYEKTYGRKYGEEPKEKIVYKTVVIDSEVKAMTEKELCQQ